MKQSSRFISKKYAKLLVHLDGSIKVIDPQEIVYIRSEGSYSFLNFSNRRPIIMSRSLAEFEGILDGLSFFRVHRSHMINILRIEEYIHGRGGTVRMEGNIELDVSVRKRDNFLKELTENFIC